MVWFIVTHIFSTLVEYVGIGSLSEQEKDLEILILRPYYANILSQCDSLG